MSEQTSAGTFGGNEVGDLTWDDIQAAHERHNIKWTGYNAESVATTIINLEQRLATLEADNARLIERIALADEAVEALMLAGGLLVSETETSTDSVDVLVRELSERTHSTRCLDGFPVLAISFNHVMLRKIWTGRYFVGKEGADKLIYRGRDESAAVRVFREAAGVESVK